MNSSQNNNTFKIVVGIIVLGIPAALAAYFFTNGSATLTTNPNPTPTTTPATTTVVTVPTPTPTPIPTPKPSPAPQSKYKNGTFTAQGSYFTPGGSENISVSLTINHDVVTASTVTPEATRGISAHFQDVFAQGYKQFVVGKNLSSLSVGKISGASLTPNGFNAAVEQIRAQALNS